MGMYTEIVIKSDIKSRNELSEKETNIINFLFGNKHRDTVKSLPDHPFFKCERWEWIGNSNSYYHHPETIRSLVGTYLFSRSDLKNYGNEIYLFFDWFDKNISDNHAGQYIGYSIYEEADKPELYFKS